MFNTRTAPMIFSEENIPEEINFSMLKSEYLPILRLPDSKHQWLALDTFEVDATIKVNPYLEDFKIGWHNSKEDGYFKEVKKFTSFVNNLEDVQLKLVLTIGRPHRSRFELTNFSVNRLSTNNPQIVKDKTYRFYNKTMGIMWDNETDAMSVIYLLTFKTKYLLELQRALIQGKPFKNTWFKLFIAPEIPGLMIKGNKFKKTFVDNFIAPYAEKSIEIEYKDNFFEELSFKDVPSYSFKTLVGSRSARKEKHKLLLEDFIVTKRLQIKLQADWEIGIQSGLLAESQLKVWRVEEVTKELIKHVDAFYYTTLEQGMRREFVVDDISREEIYDGINWVLSRSYGELKFNSLIAKFAMSSEEDIINNENPVIKLEYYLREVLLNLEKEGDCFIEYTTASYFYKVEKHKAEKISFALNKPSIVQKIDNSTKYYWDAMKFIYRSESALMKESWGNLFSPHSLNIFVTTSFSYVSDLENREAEFNEIKELLYFVDEDSLYLFENGKLTFLYNTPMLSTASLTGNSLLKDILLERISKEGERVGTANNLSQWLFRAPVIQAEDTIPVTDSDAFTLSGTTASTSTSIYGDYPEPF